MAKSNRYITPQQLSFGDRFKLNPRAKKEHQCHWTQNILRGPLQGKILVMTDRKHPFFFDSGEQLIHTNPPKSILKIMLSKEPKSLDKESLEDLKKRHDLPIKQLCQNEEMSAPLISLLEQEISQIQEEIQRRQAKRYQFIFKELIKLTELITAEAMKSGHGLSDTEHAAIRYVEEMSNRSVSDTAYAESVESWLRQGSTVLLRDTLLKLREPNNLQFNAFATLDTLAIQLRNKKGGRNA